MIIFNKDFETIISNRNKIQLLESYPQKHFSNVKQFGFLENFKRMKKNQSTKAEKRNFSNLKNKSFLSFLLQIKKHIEKVCIVPSTIILL
jgi:hypothetical protein